MTQQGQDSRIITWGDKIETEKPADEDEDNKEADDDDKDKKAENVTTDAKPALKDMKNEMTAAEEYWMKEILLLKKEMNEILPGLYVGSIVDAQNVALLTKHKITHVVSILDVAKPLDQNRKYLCVQLKESPDQVISDCFSQVTDFIHEGRQTGAVLIHCSAGISRSVAFACAYIMTVTDLSWQNALSVIKLNRSMVCPNYGFKKQLMFFEKEKLKKEKERFKLKFPAQSKYKDKEECDRRLREYKQKSIHHVTTVQPTNVVNPTKNVAPKNNITAHLK